MAQTLDLADAARARISNGGWVAAGIASLGTERRNLTCLTKRDPEEVDDPDGGKFCVVSKTGSETPAFRFFGRNDGATDDCDGEST